ncbi:5-oxoprolinase subunit B family protein [Angustibacter luteus]|uniref:Allophanate hydrolase subunit 1 n=1 Tax=Angustibacter luteus TaxID=658456 RepID=A0ABW1JDJ3_9ACTN
MRPVGDRALVADLADAVGLRSLTATLAAAPPPGTLDLVPGANSLLLTVARGTDLAAVARAVRAAAAQVGERPADPAPATPVVIDVRYDGPDLASAAQSAGLTPGELVARHTAEPWTVGFMGFAPGFGYLVGGDDWPIVPRREHPRRAVPAGSVALAGRYSGVYPRESPGGWQLIGTTSAALWDLDRAPPALLAPGTPVRFRESG